jgi:endoglucanase
MDYTSWKSKYIKKHTGAQGGVYVWYNQEGYSGSKEYVTVSEAHGYGMLLAVYNNDKDTFDSLNRYYTMRLNGNGLMKWRTQLKGGVIVDTEENNTSATDGDLDIVYALLLAYEKWGDIDYKSQSMNGLNSLYNHCMSKDLFVPLLGDWVGDSKEFKLVTRPSDFLLLHFEKFSEYHTRDYWQSVKNTCLGILETFSKTSKSSLICDFVVYDKSKKSWERPSGKVLETVNDRDYFYNSCRVPWRLSEYYNSTLNTTAKEILERYSAFFKSVTPSTDYINVGYTLEGKKLNQDYYDLAFTGPVQLMFNVLGVKDKSLRIEYDNYFGDTVYLTGKYGILYTKKTETPVFKEYNEMSSQLERYTTDISSIINNSFGNTTVKNNRDGAMFLSKDLVFKDDKFKTTLKTSLELQYGIIEFTGKGDFDCFLWRGTGGDEPEYMSNLPIKYKGVENSTLEENVYTLDWHMYQIRYFINKRLVFTWENNCYYKPMYLSVIGNTATISKLSVYEYKRQK